jgi:dinuclear metal center YbgI/SA1388 family protein
MKCKEIMNKLEERWNPSYALSWDNVGLLVGREDKEIHRIFTALDVTDETLCQALSFGADMMITHHPLLFSPVKKINSGDFIGRRLIKMIQSDLCCYAMHTNFDVMGMAVLNEKTLKLCDTEVLEVTSTDTDTGKPEGIGRVGQLMEETSLEQFAGDVKKEFDIPQIRIYGDMERKIRWVAVSSGSGKSMVSEALHKNADVIVTGDIDYHTGIDAVAAGIAVIDAGHYGTEYCFIEYMEKELKKMFPECETGKAAVEHPFQVM